MIKVLTKKDILASLIIVIGCITYFILSLRFPKGAGRFPQFSILVTFFLTMLYIGISFKDYYIKEAKGRKDDKKYSAPSFSTEKQISKFQKFKILLLFIEIFVFVIMVKQIGFYISSIIFTIIFSLTLRQDKKFNVYKYISLITIVTLIYYIFRNIFTVRFP